MNYLFVYLLMHCLFVCCSVCDVWDVVSSQSRGSHDSCHCPLHVHGVRDTSITLVKYFFYVHNLIFISIHS